MNRILRTALLMLMVFAFESVTYAKVVEYGEAIKVATDFFRTNNMLSATSDVKEVWNSTQLSQSGVATLGATSSPAFYIFAPENKKGFVIVSADDATLPILAYSLTDEALVGNELPCGLQWWCEAIVNEIAQLRASGIESPRKAAFNGIATLADDELYLETPSWDQGSPYNQECPLYNGSRCYTGCGPTATAEVMRYFKYPDSGTGTTDAYTTSSHSIFVESRNLEHKIDWDNMPFSYSSYTEEQATAVATLMADLGAVYTADYGTDGTSIATSPSTLSRIYNHYGYSWRILYTLAEAYDDAGWTALMKEQLQTCGPVLYRGTSDAGGGHMFVLDGYNTSDYFHINWGWSGSSDGYFLLPSITYHINQAAMLNFMPDDGTTPESTLVVYGDGMTASRSNFEKGVSFTMSVAGLYNNSVIDFFGDYAYALVDENDNIKEIISNVTSRTSGLSPNNILLAGDKTCTITVDMDDADCIRLVYRNTSTSDWKLMEPRSANTVYMIYVGEQNFNVVMSSPGISVSIDEFYEGISFTASGHIFNNSDSKIDRCYFRFAHTDSEGNITEWLSSNSSVSNIAAQGYADVTDVSCTIAADLNAGDRIRMYYQANNTADDGWQLVTSESQDVPWEVEITESMIIVRNYDIRMYTPGISVSTDKFYRGVSFTTETHPANVSGYEVPIANFAIVLTDSEHNIKEFISEIFSRSNFSNMTTVSYTNRACTINTEVKADDRICMAFQANHTYDDDWTVVDTYYGTECPVEVVITEDNIGNPDYVMKMYSPGLSADTDVFHQNSPFTADAYAVNRSGETVDRSNFRFALMDSEGNVKELISSITYVTDFRNNYYISITGKSCTITSEMEVGDWICLVYQNNATDDDGWKVVEPDSESIPWKIELTEDNIGEPREPECAVMMSSPGLVLSTDLFYKGVTFTSEFHPSNHSNAFVDTYLRIGLANSNGDIKEWISDYQLFDVEVDYRRDFTDVPCTITGDVAVGDRIGMYYEKIKGNEDSWALPTLYGSGFPIEVEITEDMIASTSFTITSAGYATYYTNVEYTMPEDVKGTIVTGVEEEAEGDGGYILNMTWDYASGSTVPANTPLVLKGEPNTYEITVTSTGANAPTGNLLLGSTTETLTYGPDTSASYLFYALSDGEYGVGFYYGIEGGGAFTSEANKAWLALTPEQANNAKFLGFGDDVTGISSIRANYGETDAIYTIQGVRVNDMKKKGIYIVNGKKVLVK